MLPIGPEGQAEEQRPGSRFFGAQPHRLEVKGQAPAVHAAPAKDEAAPVDGEPDAVLIGGSGTPAALPEKTLKERGYKGKYYQTHGVANADFLRVGGKDVEGTLLPGGVSAESPWSHASEECIVVTAGVLTVEVGDEVHRLEVGDSCYFDSRLGHRYVNDGEEPTVFLVSITPPSY